MSIVSTLLGVGAAILFGILYILFVALIMALANKNIPEQCKNCPLLFNYDRTTLPFCAECQRRHQSSTLHEKI